MGSDIQYAKASFGLDAGFDVSVCVFCCDFLLVCCFCCACKSDLSRISVPNCISELGTIPGNACDVMCQ